MSTLPDIVLYPHCDLHIALNGPPLRVRVDFRPNKTAADPIPLAYSLNDATNLCTYEFFAPHSPVGTRLNNCPSIDPATGLVTATTPGVYLFQVTGLGRYIVARLQVHAQILGWWFGNASITTAVDSAFAHAQPSIYASFTTEAGTDPVGDITGHGYVTLTPSPVGRLSVTTAGRLRGISEGDDTVSGTFLGVTHDLPVHVVNYETPRNDLEAIRTPDIAGAANMHNLVFVPEGFRDTADDRKKFDEIVTKVVDEMFSKDRHQPYPLLQGSFNVWKAYIPSRQHVLTCAFPINELKISGEFDAGFHIPYTYHPKDDKSKYTVAALVERVGLPKSDEAGDRTALVDLWKTQNLHDFDPTKVDDVLVRAWKLQKITRFLEARDTIFGFRLGSRLADRSAGFGSAVARPAGDDGSAALQAFVRRVYEFYETETPRSLLLDPRRHPPELVANTWGDTNAGNALITYLTHLHWNFAPHQNVGQHWAPDPLDATFNRSRGLVAVICHDGLMGGSGGSNNSYTANTLANIRSVRFEVVTTGQERIMRRNPPDSIPTEIDEIINTITHEIGHSFNLNDEYEDFAGASSDAGLHADFAADNTARLGFIFANGTLSGGQVTFNDETIDVSKVKWMELPRMILSDALLKDAELVPPVVKLTVDKRHISAWTAAKKRTNSVFLRSREFTARGGQLPLPVDNTHFLAGLEIGAVDEALGTVLIAAAGLPAIGSPVFKAGAVLYVPRRNPDDSPRMVVEPEVRAHQLSTKRPLNKETDTTKVNKEEDDTEDITGFGAPCKGWKMIGVYEGANHQAARYYRPAGLCKMRKNTDEGKGDGEFCHVCKWLLVNRVDPGLHAILDDKYFPEAKGKEVEPPNV